MQLGSSLAIEGADVSGHSYPLCIRFMISLLMVALLSIVNGEFDFRLSTAHHFDDRVHVEFSHTTAVWQSP
ncbi:hypothetical protein BT69DRAFT_229108 [Atractiella rhizophila]|nr:hypothetical protein BT69DRAFT_229108 [Atractiella rhizophila]